MKERQRENWIDLVKAIAIFIVVMNHAKWIIPGVNFLGGMFFVPVFFVLSGYTWHEKPGSYPCFVKEKAKRLLVPYGIANGLLILFFSFKGGWLFEGKWWEIGRAFLGAFYGRNQLYWEEGGRTLFGGMVDGNVYFLTCLNSPTWFLPALFLTLLFAKGLFRICKKQEKRVWLCLTLLFLAGVLYHNLTPILLPWSLDAVPFFLLLFFFGYEIRERKLLDLFTKKPYLALGLALIFTLTAYLNKSANFSIADYHHSITLALINAGISSLLIMWICRMVGGFFSKVKFIMGRHTLLILCYHLFVLAVFDALIGDGYVVLKVILTLVLLTFLGSGLSLVKGVWKKNREG